jgi:hypothetical protein
MFQESINACDKAFSFNPDHHLMRYRKAQTLYDLGGFEVSIYKDEMFY